MPKIIAFGHEKHVGKDTAARFLCSHLRLKYKKSNIKVVGFSDAGKDICHQLYAWAGLKSRDFYEIPGNENHKEDYLPAIGKTVRQVWIDFMSFVGRAVYADTWVDYLYYSEMDAQILIIKDFRFPNEGDKILKHGGFIYKIERPSIPRTPDHADDALIGYNRWSRIIINDGSLANFNKKIIEIAEEDNL